MNLARLKATGKRPHARGKARLSAHRLFAPVWGLWGAALGGLSVLVIPRALIWQQLGDLAAAYSITAVRLGMAMVAAVLLGLICFGIAYALHRNANSRSKGTSVAEMAGRRVRPIDPASELGSERFDAPVQAIPFGIGAMSDHRNEDVDQSSLSEPTDWLPDDEAENMDRIEVWSTPAQPHTDFADIPVDVAQPEPPQTLDELDLKEYEFGPKYEPLTVPRELDLAEFARLPGRNAVWVEEPAGDAAEVGAPVASTAHALADAEPVVTAPAPARPPAPAAVARLREVPPTELCLVRMVERFAAALHDHQAKAQDGALPAQPGNTAARLQRDAALAEALRALSLFTENGLAELNESGPGNEAHEHLRAAMVKLQRLRGAA